MAARSAIEDVSSSPSMDCIVGVSRNKNMYRMSLPSALSRGHSCSISVGNSDGRLLLSGGMFSSFLQQSFSPLSYR